MQSTFSAVEPGGDDMIFADELEDEEDDDDLDEAATLGKRLFVCLLDYYSLLNVILYLVYFLLHLFVVKVCFLTMHVVILLLGLLITKQTLMKLQMKLKMDRVRYMDHIVIM